MIEFYRDKAGQWRFRIKGGNGETVAQGEAYRSKANCMLGLETLKRILNDSPPTIFIDGDS